MSSSDRRIIKESSSKRECSIDVGKITATDHHQVPSSSSRSWQGLPKDSRIVRVARSLGGKDRHSKVCTVRGLIRDRRVRLSVQTAIQLYNLQDRLGFNQPSKVVDWLLEAAQEEIDKLPPLQFPVESMAKFAQPMLVEPGNEMTTSGFGVEKDTRKPDAQMMKNYKSKQSLGKETNWLKICSVEENQNINSHSKTEQPTLAPGLVNNDIYSSISPSFYQWDHSPSSSYFSYMGGSGLPLQTHEVEGNSTLSSNAMTKSISLPSSAGNSQVLYQYPSMLPSFVCPTTMDSDSKNMTNHNIVQMLNHPNISQNYLLQ